MRIFAKPDCEAGRVGYERWQNLIIYLSIVSALVFKCDVTMCLDYNDSSHFKIDTFERLKARIFLNRQLTPRH